MMIAGDRPNRAARAPWAWRPLYAVISNLNIDAGILIAAVVSYGATVFTLRPWKAH